MSKEQSSYLVEGKMWIKTASSWFLIHVSMQDWYIDTGLPYKPCVADYEDGRIISIW